MATEKQINYVQGLARYRELPADHGNTELVMAMLSGKGDVVKTGEASGVIDWLKTLPQIGNPAPASMQDLILTVPCSSYALELDGKLRFFRVKEWTPKPGNKIRYLRELHGAPGHFNTSKLIPSAAREVLELLAGDPTTHAKCFADHYTCCSVCMSELTDEVSRSYGIGPVCRAKFGI